MPSLGDIEAQVKQYADCRATLAAEVEALDTEISRIKRSHMARIRRLAGKTAERKNRLKAMIEDEPEYFRHPKTMILHGVRIGFAKARGKLAFDKQQTLKLIHKRMEDKADDLIKITQTPIRAALDRLPASDLKKIGVTVIEASDEVVIKPTDSDIDKLVDALLREGEKK
jgi:hypothetical protein